MINFHLRKGYRIFEILRALRVSSSTYYDWLHWHPSPQAKHHEVLRQQVVDTWNDNFRIYGYPRVAAAMIKKGIRISKRFVWQLMKESGIGSRMQKKFTKPTTKTDTD
ncbi:IS3 family transposase [Lactobacillaceae bacterium Melli_B3]